VLPLIPIENKKMVSTRLTLLVLVDLLFKVWLVVGAPNAGGASLNTNGGIRGEYIVYYMNVKS
jgi:hypothetical protein